MVADEDGCSLPVLVWLGVRLQRSLKNFVELAWQTVAAVLI